MTAIVNLIICWGRFKMNWFFDKNLICYFCRIYNDGGFIYIANFGSDEVTNLNLTLEFENVPALAKVYMTSVGSSPNIPAIGETLRTDAVRVGANHSIILVFPEDFVAPTPTTPVPTEPTTEEDGESTTENGGGGGGEDDGNKDSGSGSIFNSVQNLSVLIASVVILHLQFRD